MSDRPARLALAGGASIRARRLPSVGKVVITSPDARFLLLGAADFEAVEAGAPEARRRLEQAGFVHHGDPSSTKRDEAQEPKPGLVDPRALDEGALTALLDRGAPLTLDLGEPPHTEAWRAVRAIHARYAQRGVDPVRAYLNAVLTVDRAAMASGPGAVVAQALEAGLVYLEIRPARVALDSPPPSDYLAFQRAAWTAILDVNQRGTLLVEKRLALHLEALVAGSKSAALPSDGSSPCGACAYDPYCASPLLRRWLWEEALPKAWGTPSCEASMGTFDEIFTRLGSPEGALMRRVLSTWMAAQKRVAAGMTASTPGDGTAGRRGA